MAEHEHADTGHRYHGCPECFPKPVRVLVEVQATSGMRAVQFLSEASARENDRLERSGGPRIPYAVLGVLPKSNDSAEEAHKR